MKHKPIAIVLAFFFLGPAAFGQNPVTANNQWTPIEKQDAMGITMVQVPAGSFVMGSQPSDLDYALQLCKASKQDGSDCTQVPFVADWLQFEWELDGGTQTFSEPFWIDETEVTIAAYNVCVESGSCKAALMDDEFSISADQPVNQVDWFHAAAYCGWRGASLPTEAQWEYAARGPDGLIFPWGNTLLGNEANHCDNNCANAVIRNVSLDHDDGNRVTAPVGSYPNGASWVGALDMAGNVWEWTRTQFLPNPYDANDGRDLSGNEERNNSEMVIRGGGFDGGADVLRSAIRIRDASWHLDPNLGFRCVRSDADF